MSARVTWNGLDQLRAELRRLPRELADEALPIVTQAAEAAKTEIGASYPRRAGALAAGLETIVRQRGSFGAIVVVRNKAKHAHLFETGTQARHTALGANRGSMPSANNFVPRVLHHRRRMYEQLADLLERHGLRVSGSF